MFRAPSTNIVQARATSPPTPLLQSTRSNVVAATSAGHSYISSQLVNQ